MAFNTIASASGRSTPDVKQAAACASTSALALGFAGSVIPELDIDDTTSASDLRSGGCVIVTPSEAGDAGSSDPAGAPEVGAAASFQLRILSATRTIAPAPATASKLCVRLRDGDT